MAAITELTMTSTSVKPRCVAGLVDDIFLVRPRLVTALFRRPADGEIDAVLRRAADGDVRVCVDTGERHLRLRDAAELERLHAAGGAVERRTRCWESRRHARLRLVVLSDVVEIGLRDRLRLDRVAALLDRRDPLREDAEQRQDRD